MEKTHPLRGKVLPPEERAKGGLCSFQVVVCVRLHFHDSPQHFLHAAKGRKSDYADDTRGQVVDIGR